MAGTLVFSVNDTLRGIVAHARSATERRPTFVELFEDAYIKPESRHKEWRERKESDVDQSKLKPALWLVKDHGVYLMSNGADHPKRAGHPFALDVAYAEGLNGDKDDCWDLARQIMGGDDCVESLDLAAFERKIAANEKEIRVRVTASHITIL